MEHEMIREGIHKEGYLFTAGNRAYFLATPAQKKTVKVLQAIIEGVGKANKVHPDVISRAKMDKGTLDDFRRRTDAATLQERYTDNGTHYFRIFGSQFSCSYPEADFKAEVTILEG